MDMMQLLEDSIVGRLIAALVDDGYRLEISDQDGGGLYVYAESDDLPKDDDGRFRAWVKLVPGNRKDIIVDYSVNLEASLAPVNAYASSFAD